MAGVTSLHSIGVAALTIDAGDSAAEILPMAALAACVVVSMSAKDESMEFGAIAGVHPSLIVQAVLLWGQSAADHPILQLLELVAGDRNVTRCALPLRSCEHRRARIAGRGPISPVIAARHGGEIAVDGVSTFRVRT